VGETCGPTGCAARRALSAGKETTRPSPEISRRWWALSACQHRPFGRAEALRDPTFPGPSTPSFQCLTRAMPPSSAGCGRRAKIVCPPPRLQRRSPRKRWGHSLFLARAPSARHPAAWPPGPQRGYWVLRFPRRQPKSALPYSRGAQGSHTWAGIARRRAGRGDLLLFSFRGPRPNVHTANPSVPRRAGSPRGGRRPPSRGSAAHLPAPRLRRRRIGSRTKRPPGCFRGQIRVRPPQPPAAERLTGLGTACLFRGRGTRPACATPFPLTATNGLSSQPSVPVTRGRRPGFRSSFRWPGRPREKPRSRTPSFRTVARTLVGGCRSRVPARLTQGGPPHPPSPLGGSGRTCRSPSPPPVGESGWVAPPTTFCTPWAVGQSSPLGGKSPLERYP